MAPPKVKEEVRFTKLKFIYFNQQSACSLRHAAEFWNRQLDSICWVFPLEIKCQIAFLLGHHSFPFFKCSRNILTGEHFQLLLFIVEKMNLTFVYDTFFEQIRLYDMPSSFDGTSDLNPRP